MKGRSKIPEKTIERLLLYRRILINSGLNPNASIYSHQLAQLSSVTSAQVRRDLMSIGYFGSPVHGYEIGKLIDSIGEFVDDTEVQRVALIGLGHLGRAILDYFRGRRPKLTITAAFDIDPEKVNRVLHGVRCYSIDQLTEVIRQEQIKVAIIAIPESGAQEIADQLVQAGVSGILNYAPIKLNVPPEVYIENRDMLLAVEKVAFFARRSKR